MIEHVWQIINLTKLIINLTFHTIIWADYIYSSRARNGWMRPGTGGSYSLWRVARCRRYNTRSTRRDSEFKHPALIQRRDVIGQLDDQSAPPISPGTVRHVSEASLVWLSVFTPKRRATISKNVLNLGGYLWDLCIGISSYLMLARFRHFGEYCPEARQARFAVGAAQKEHGDAWG